MKSLAAPNSGDDRSWTRQPRVARLYVAAVTGLGAVSVLLFSPRDLPRPGLFAVILLAACLTSVWKVNLPLSFVSGSTLSVSFSADMMALMLLGPELAILIAAAGVWVQCTVNAKERQPKYRTIFSVGAEAVTMALTGVVYRALGGTVVGSDITTAVALVAPVAGAITTYFLVNTGLVAGAIALSTSQPLLTLWGQEFLWCAASVMVSGVAGAAAAMVVVRGQHWTVILLLVPVYLVYWTYRMFTGRLSGQRRLEDTVRQQQRSASGSQETYVFGPFRVDLRKRRLWKDDQLIALTPKALDTLLVLIRHAGHVVERDDLLRAVWPDTFVSEETLTQNIATIRRALGDSSEHPDYVATVPRRGYRFIGIVTIAAEEHLAASGTSYSSPGVRGGMRR